MRNLLSFRGIHLSEPMCFGLGSGAGFLYLPDMPVPPGVAFHGRILEMERELCGALSIPFPEREEDPKTGWRLAREAVRSGHPVLISTDLAYLEYFDTKTHFSGHRIVLIGFDDGAGLARLSDSERAEPQEVSVTSLMASRSSTVPPYPMKNRWCIVRPDGPLRPLAEAIPLALGKNARTMLAQPEGSAEGVSGIRRTAREIVRWPDMTKDWTFAARFGYQVIEKRGTGGGFFRRIYAAYLDEASSHCPVLSSAGLAGKMAGVADGWTEIASRLKEVSESGNPGGFSRVSDLLFRQADLEQAFWERAASLFRRE